MVRQVAMELCIERRDCICRGASKGHHRMGMLGVLVSVIYGIQLFVHSVTGARPWHDTTTIIFLLLFFGSMIITILGVIGEYLARIYLEVKKRPIYISRESNIIGEKFI